MASIQQQLAAPKQKYLNNRGYKRTPSSQPDDSTLARQIRDTHSLGQSHTVDVTQILQVIEEIFHRSTHGNAGILLGTREHIDTLEDRTSTLPSVDVLFYGLSYLIQKIYYEISSQSMGRDLNASTMEILRTLSNYSWEAKVVLTLAAFSVYYGEFWLVAQLCTTDPLAKSVAILKQLSNMLEHTASVKPQLEAIDNLIKAITNVTKRIVEYSEMVRLQSHYISEEKPPLSSAAAHIPAAAYWAIRAILSSASHIASLTGGSKHEYNIVTTEVWELSSLTHKLNNIDDHLTNELENCRRHIVAKRYEEDYETLRRLFQSLHLDNMKNLRALISHKDDVKPLEIGTSKSRSNLEVLRRKHVLLLITDLSLSYEEILVLDHIYKDQQQRVDIEYEFVWVPIVDAGVWDEAKKFRFEELKARMPWHSVYDPLIVEPPAIKFIRNDWHFDKKMIIVALDPQGRVSSLNAIHMLWIWGNVAFPFTDEREQSLWNAESWRLELVADGIDQSILSGIVEAKYICLYGGDDVEWIRRFTTRAKAVAKLAGIALDLVYTGRSTATKERLRKVNKVIETENLSRCWPDYASTWFFWSRIDSMRCSKAKFHKTLENDAILKEAMTLLSYDGSDQGWVMVWRGNDIARANGHLTVLTLDDFDAWKTTAAELGFVPTLQDELRRRHTPHHCTRLIIPGFGPDIPDSVQCAECGRDMEKYFLFRCCTD